MSTSDSTVAAVVPSRTDSRGFAAAAGAFLIWGLLPAYLKQLQTVPALQVTAHRLVWGCLFTVGWLALRRELPLIRTALVVPSTRWRLVLSAALVSVNWIVYVWGVANHHVVETSLGYFINPLLSVVLGVLVLSERLNPVQWTAVGIAACGVVYLNMRVGQKPRV
jgi:chloramphenicol-sensitive protein RarD